MIDLCSILKESKVVEAQQRNIFPFKIHLKYFPCEKNRMHIYEFWLFNVPTWLRINQIFTYFHIFKWCETKLALFFHFTNRIEWKVEQMNRTSVSKRYGKLKGTKKKNEEANMRNKKNDFFSSYSLATKGAFFSSFNRTIIFSRWQIWKANGRRENGIPNRLLSFSFHSKWKHLFFQSKSGIGNVAFKLR